MAQFVELENGDILNKSYIKLIYPNIGVKNDSEKIKIRGSIRVECDGGTRDLISKTWTEHWPDRDPENEMEFYKLFCAEREKLKEAIRDLFPYIVHGLFMDLNIYYTSLEIQERLQQAVKETTERIAEAAKKMEAENE